MTPQKPYQRDPDAMRLRFLGMNTMLPPDKMPPNKFPYAQNCRAYLRDRIVGRSLQDDPVQTLPFAVHSIRRLNDSTPAGPATGFILVEGASANLYANSVQVDSGFSGNPLSLVPFRPNASVQPWMYVGDSLKMDKVRSDGLTYKMGIAEPQAAPTISSIAAAQIVSLVGPVTVTYWGDSPHSGPLGVYIWKNASDPSGSGPVRTNVSPNGITTGDSLLFDVIPGTLATPMEWTQFATFAGAVNTDTIGGTFNVHWVSGTQFGGLVPAGLVIIGTTVYTIATVPTNVLLTLTSSAGVQTDVDYQAAAISGAVALFQPALESEGYADFNMAVEGTLYIPPAGVFPQTYTFNLNSFNDAMWGIGSTGSGTASWPGPTGGQNLSSENQTKTVLGGYPLMPRLYTSTSGGPHITASIAVTFSAPGNYPIEIDYDYWYHTGRTLTVQANGADIPPISGSVITEAQYRYVYRSSATGALSNPSPESPESSLSVLANTVQAVGSPDPQVDKIDYYRLDVGLQNYTYVGTGPNIYPGPPPPFSDSLLDADVAANPILQFDNFEPFPSIDLPHSGVVNVSGGVATLVSGDAFNIRWLPGTIIIVGTIAYTLDRRPTSTSKLTATNTEIIAGVSTVVPLADGTGLTYEIAEPILAAQPLPYMWGPTDNVNFAFACGDPLRPGTLYWSKGNNLDSAPDTNQQDVTSPSEPLQNGCISNGLGVLFSTQRGFLIYPNFFNALATVTGTEGATWTLQESALKRGLYIPRCLTVDGGGNVFFRAQDGIYISPGGQGGESITDGDLYNLFPHEGSLPQPVVRGAYTTYPPDDTKPIFQRLNCANGFLYYDYQDTTGTQRTLVFDIESRAWVVDQYAVPPLVHVLEEVGGLSTVSPWTITSITRAGGTVNAFISATPTSPPLGFNTGSEIRVVGVSDPSFNSDLSVVIGIAALHAGSPSRLIGYQITWNQTATDASSSGGMLEGIPNLSQGDVLCGCSDGTVRPLTNTGTEAETAVILMPCMNAGDTRASKKWGDCFIEAGPAGS
jgi:hypothetical protein